MVSCRYPAARGMLGKHHTMEDAGQRLRRTRERLGLRFRDVEQASLKIADKYQNDEFSVLINRLSEIENHGLLPNIYKLYSCRYHLSSQFSRTSGVVWSSSWLTYPPTPYSLKMPTSHLVGFSKGNSRRSITPNIARSRHRRAPNHLSQPNDSALG